MATNIVDSAHSTYQADETPSPHKKEQANCLRQRREKGVSGCQGRSQAEAYATEAWRYKCSARGHDILCAYMRKRRLGQACGTK